MKIEFSSHALKRIKEREISGAVIREAVKFPNKVEFSDINKNRFLIKKVYYRQELKKDHLLMLICEKENNNIKVITIIDTSKISKYL